MNSDLIAEGLDTCKAFNPEHNGFDVQVQDIPYVGINLYLCKELATTDLASDMAIDSYTATVTSATGALVGDCINIRQGSNIFQSVIKNVNGNIITFGSPVDIAFTSGANVCFAEWNLATANASTSARQVFKACPPSGADYHITAISFTITDNIAMDDVKFGGITALTNGIIARRTDGSIANFFLISNNGGFYQYGYDTQYVTRSSGGSLYGFNARKKMSEVNGAVIELKGSSSDEFQIIVQDNLTDLSEFTVQIHGHIVRNT